MFEVTKAIINNLNEIPYLKNKNRISFIESRKENSINKVEINKDQICAELEDLQIAVRHDNLKLFGLNMLKARAKQFAIITAPALLVAGNVALWASPSSKIKTESLNTYQRTETVFNEDEMLYSDVGDTLYYSTFLGRTYANDNAANLSGNAGTILYFQITEELDGFLSTFTISSEGKLYLSDVDDGSYIDLNDYDLTDATELEDKYKLLINEVINLMSESSYLNNTEKERLLEISESDKKDILAKIVEIEYIGKTDVDVVKSRWMWRIILSIVAIIYIWVLVSIYRENGPFESTVLENDNGSLSEGEYTEDLGLVFLGLKYKEIFLQAERDRIKRIYDLSQDILSYQDANTILTKYEKKLILSEKE